MSTKKAGGSSTNLTDSGPQYLGTKLYDGEKAKVGSIIVRQRGTVIMAGKNVKIGKDHTLYSVKDGIVKFANKRHLKFNGTSKVKKIVHVN